LGPISVCLEAQTAFHAKCEIFPSISDPVLHFKQQRV
jgi:hypothetical protein